MRDDGRNRRKIGPMFDALAPRYDLLNRLLSLGIDRYWRRRAVRWLDLPRQGLILDAASGTGDVALEIARQGSSELQLVACDLSPGMLKRARHKMRKRFYGGRFWLLLGDCEALPLQTAVCVGAIIAFGIRNVGDRRAGLRELRRVLKPGAPLVVLEFSQPLRPLLRACYLFYFRRILPFIGGLLSDSSAYRYLPDSVQNFPARNEFKQMLTEAGFAEPEHRDLSAGIVTLYRARTPGENLD